MKNLRIVMSILMVSIVLLGISIIKDNSTNIVHTELDNISAVSVQKEEILGDEIKEKN